MKETDFVNDWFMFGKNKPLVLALIDRVRVVAIKAAGVKRIRTHDIRRSHASNLIASGANIVAVSIILGHSNVNMTLKVYTHLFKESEKNLIDKINKNILKTIF